MKLLLFLFSTLLSISVYAAKGVSISTTDTYSSIYLEILTKDNLVLQTYLNDFDASYFNTGIPRMSLTMYDPTVTTLKVNGVEVPMENCEIILHSTSPTRYSDQCNK
jgi:hypothetical protein